MRVPNAAATARSGHHCSKARVAERFPSWALRPPAASQMAEEGDTSSISTNGTL